MFWIFLFWLGGMIYQIIEMLWSGHSHWSMFLLGGTCVVLVYTVYINVTAPVGILISCVVGGAIITTLEYLTGMLMNKRLKKNIWDYSKRKFNVNGQICLQYSLYWVLLSPAAIFFAKGLNSLFK
ncbi:MAG: hypothetical protein DBX47_07470 [Clostridiales bacterium]|nr:MAG: hypothetical protein DBX47_07470 [Clostridiales bacterium]